ncbi:putative porin [Bowmanella dokdonensis]|uniref:Porin n=1 Tax=Bowmanella dokdonensis TaxID=751969 RepID=A0A939ISC0_9ALTE|nr:putative porin [Bowmanella dokdonensis]MBN7826261.1 putative porin [Bowmanella dokdonensis]
MKKLTVLASMLLCSTLASAQSYQSFTQLYVQKIDSDYQDTELWSVGSQYYFSPKQTLGPLAEFDYINSKSNVKAGYADNDYYDSWNVGGELFYGNLLLGAQYYKSDYDQGSADTKSFSVGYLLSPNLLVKLQAVAPERSDTHYSVTASYTHQLQGKDYLGFTATLDEDLDAPGFSSRYFTHLGDERYLGVGFSYQKIELSTADLEYSDEDYWSATLDYYFSQTSSVGVSCGDDNSFSLAGKHYFTENLAMSVNYSGATDDSDYKTYGLSLIGQF